MIDPAVISYIFQGWFDATKNGGYWQRLDKGRRWPFARKARYRWINPT